MTAAQRARQRAYRRRTGNATARKYEKSPRGFLMRAYRNALSRVTGVQWHKAHLYAGKPIMPKTAFYRWAWDNPDFWRLFRAWEASGYDRRLTPSLNRIDPDRGYEPGNVEWVTHSVNSALGGHRERRAFYRTLRKALSA